MCGTLLKIHLKSVLSFRLPTTLVFVLVLATLFTSVACKELNREKAESSDTPASDSGDSSKTLGPKTEIDFKEIHFSQVAVHTAKPSQIQIVFSLRDENNHALANIPEDIFKDAFRITENMVELAYDETAYFVKGAASFDLEVVFVLDFTASMDKAEVGEDKNGIDAMVEAFNGSLKNIPKAHRIGVVEFHDKNMEPQVLAQLTDDREEIKESVEDFRKDTKAKYIPGFSRVWDSIPIAVSLFSEEPHTTRAVVVITDGHDTSSDIDREKAFDIISAEDNKIQTYVMGVGDVFQEGFLERLVLGTGGAYYPTAELSKLPQQLKTIVDDLEGQYKLSFITGRRTGKISFGLELTLKNSQDKSVTGKWTSQEVDVGPINDKGTIGRITADPPSVDEENNTTTMFIRALHIPREIRNIRFKLETDKDPLDFEVPIEFDNKIYTPQGKGIGECGEMRCLVYEPRGDLGYSAYRPSADTRTTIEIVTKEQGGLLEGWEQSGPDEAGFYTISGEQALAYGSFGLLFQLKFSDAAANLVPEDHSDAAANLLPEDYSGIGWYIESINNSPTNEDKLREAISLLIDEAGIDHELFYFPNWPSLDKASQSFDPLKAGRLFAEMGDFRPWGKRKFGNLCVVSPSMKSDLQGRLLEIGSDLAAGLKAEADLVAVPNGSSCTAGRIIITAPRK